MATLVGASAAFPLVNARDYAPATRIASLGGVPRLPHALRGLRALRGSRGNAHVGGRGGVQQGPVASRCAARAGEAPCPGDAGGRGARDPMEGRGWPAPVRAAALSATVVAAVGFMGGPAVAAAYSVAIPGVSIISGLFNGAILGASANASFKLFLICISVTVLMSGGALPRETPTVLSKVSFNILIPCFLFSRVAITLAGKPDPSMFALPLAAALQVSVGAVLGLLAAHLVYRNSVTMGGWHPNAPPASARSVATAVSDAMGVPQALEALLPTPIQPPMQQKRMLAAACAFGNTLTLPLVFIMSLLSGAEADRAAGYIAIFMVGWSPALWSLGYQLLGDDGRGYGGEPGVAAAGGGNGGGGAGGNGGGSGGQKALPPAAEVVIEAGVRSAPAVPAPPRRETWQEQLQMFVARVFNPPLYAILAGVVVGSTPLSGLLFPQPGLDPLVVATLPIEIQLVVQGLRSAMEVVVLFGSATLAIQAIVLASSIASEPSDAQEATTRRIESGEQIIPDEDDSLPFFAMLLPKDPTDVRTLVAVSTVRLLIMPLVSLGITVGMLKLGWLPADPVAALVVAVQGAMPSAQNLVLLSQLRASTRWMAPGVARLLLRQYTLAILPIPLWLTLFVAVIMPGGSL